MKTDLLSPTAMAAMATSLLAWLDLMNIAPDEYQNRNSKILNDLKEGRISWDEYVRRMRKLEEDVLPGLGEPEQSRPDNDSVLSTHEQKR